jgi:AcrR family transcriptional regulator
MLTMPQESSREELVAAARRACAGGRQPTMQDIAAAAGVAVRTLYHFFGSRKALLSEAGCRPAPDTRDQILESALEIVGRGGLAGLSMDDLAAAAGVSRATLYRLFPGKSALFGALIRTYSPWAAVADVVDAMPDGTPQEVMPVVGMAMAEAMQGRAWLLLRLLSELLSGGPETAEGMQHGLARGLPDLIRYLVVQMRAGRLRSMDPLVALQLLAGPIVADQLTRPLAESLIGFATPLNEFVDQIVGAWLRAMAPEDEVVGDVRSV